MSLTTRTIEIYLLYLSQNGKEYSFFEIVNEAIPIALSDYEPSGFWGISGGIQIVVNDFCTVFRNTDFHYLVKVTSFLLHSMYWLDGKHSDWLDSDDEYTDSIVLRTTANNVLRLNTYDMNTLSLSYIPPGGIYQNKRGNSFFNEVLLSKDLWRKACAQGLSEYFEALLKVARTHPNNDTSETMINYYKVWSKLIGEFIF